MIVLDCAQGSDEWKAARVGVVTASNMKRILTPKTRKTGAGARTYMLELAAERVLGRPLEDFQGTTWTDRGTDVEGEARSWYEFDRDVDTVEVGFVYLDERRTIGCSPDCLVGDDGGLEIKCPSLKVHIGYLLDGIDTSYRMQVHGCMWVTGRQWWDLISYCPNMPPVVERIERGDDLIGDLSRACEGVAAGVTNALEVIARARANSAPVCPI